MPDVLVTLPEDRDVIVLDNGQPAQIATLLIDAAVALGLDPRVVRVQPYVGGFIAPASVVSTIDVTPEPPGGGALGTLVVDTPPPYLITMWTFIDLTLTATHDDPPEGFHLEASTNGGEWVRMASLTQGEGLTFAGIFGTAYQAPGDVVVLRAIDAVTRETSNEVVLDQFAAPPSLALERIPADEPYTAGPPFTLRLTLPEALVAGQSFILYMGVDGGGLLEYGIPRTDVSPTVFEWSVATDGNAGHAYVYEVILWGPTSEEGRSNQVTATII